MALEFEFSFGDYGYRGEAAVASGAIIKRLAECRPSPVLKATQAQAPGLSAGSYLRRSRLPERRVALAGTIEGTSHAALRDAKDRMYAAHADGPVKRLVIGGDRYLWAAPDGPVDDAWTKGLVWSWELQMLCGDPHYYDAGAEKAAAVAVEQDRDVVFVLDLSGSMALGFAGAAGVRRFDAAVAAVRKAVARLSVNPGNRFGLVTFGDDAALAQALTSSAVAFDAALGALAPTEPQTFTWVGIQLARATLEAADTAGRRPAVMVLSDGESLEPTLTEAAGADLKTDHPDWLLYAVAVNAAGFDPSELVYVGDTVGDGYFAAADPGQLDAAASAVVPAGTAVVAGGSATATPYLTFDVAAPGPAGAGRVLLVNDSAYLRAEGLPPEVFLFHPRHAGTHVAYFGDNCTDDAVLNRQRAHQVWHPGRDEKVTRWRADPGPPPLLRAGANSLFAAAGGGCALSGPPALRWRDRWL